MTEHSVSFVGDVGSRRALARTGGLIRLVRRVNCHLCARNQEIYSSTRSLQVNLWKIPRQVHQQRASVAEERRGCRSMSQTRSRAPAPAARHRAPMPGQRNLPDEPASRPGSARPGSTLPRPMAGCSDAMSRHRLPPDRHCASAAICSRLLPAVAMPSRATASAPSTRTIVVTRKTPPNPMRGYA